MLSTHLPGRVFVMSGSIDTKMSLAVGQQNWKVCTCLQSHFTLLASEMQLYLAFCHIFTDKESRPLLAMLVGKGSSYSLRELYAMSLAQKYTCIIMAESKAAHLGVLLEML